MAALEVGAMTLMDAEHNAMPSSGAEDRAFYQAYDRVREISEGDVMFEDPTTGAGLTLQEVSLMATLPGADFREPRIVPTIVCACQFPTRLCHEVLRSLIVPYAGVRFEHTCTWVAQNSGRRTLECLGSYLDYDNGRDAATLGYVFVQLPLGPRVGVRICGYNGGGVARTFQPQGCIVAPGHRVRDLWIVRIHDGIDSEMDGAVIVAFAVRGTGPRLTTFMPTDFDMERLEAFAAQLVAVGATTPIAVPLECVYPSTPNADRWTRTVPVVPAGPDAYVVERLRAAGLRVWCASWQIGSPAEISVVVRPTGAAADVKLRARGVQVGALQDVVAWMKSPFAHCGPYEFMFCNATGALVRGTTSSRHEDAWFMHVCLALPVEWHWTRSSVSGFDNRIVRMAGEQGENAMIVERVLACMPYYLTQYATPGSAAVWVHKLRKDLDALWKTIFAVMDSDNASSGEFPRAPSA